MPATLYDSAQETYRKVRANIELVMQGQSASIRKLMAAMATGGHVLLENCPGTDKTTLAKALALFEGRQFVAPDQIRELAVPVIAHRVIMEPQTRFSGQTAQGIIEEILRKNPAPA